MADGLRALTINTACFHDKAQALSVEYQDVVFNREPEKIDGDEIVANVLEKAGLVIT